MSLAKSRVFQMYLGTTLPCVLLAAAVAIGGIASVASAQSDNDLRRENQRLRGELRDSQRELESARERIAELERQVARLQRSLDAATGSRDTATDDLEVTIDESEPSASPRALFTALVTDYSEAVADLEIGNSGDRARALYMRTLNRWQSQTMRKFRAQVQWSVRVEEATQTRSGYDLRLIAVDPKTHAVLGDSFDVALPRSMARRYEQITARSSSEVLVLRGTLLPQVTINEQRQVSGAFDNPKLIGPFAEFRFTIEPRSLLAVGDEE